MLQSVADKMIANLKDHQTTKQNPALVYSMANRIIVPHADLMRLSVYYRLEHGTVQHQPNAVYSNVIYYDVSKNVRVCIGSIQRSNH